MMDVLIRHPAVGSVWLSNVKYKGSTVIGEAWDNSEVGSPMMPDDYQGMPVVMNFPRACVVKEDKHE